MASNSDTGAHSADEGRRPEQEPPSDNPSGSAPCQNCAFCGVVWMHPLATDRVQFRRFGKAQPLASSWTLCDSCERLYQDCDDDRLIQMLKFACDWLWLGTDVQDMLSKPIDAIREADPGRRPMGSTGGAGLPDGTRLPSLR